MPTKGHYYGCPELQIRHDPLQCLISRRCSSSSVNHPREVAWPQWISISSFLPYSINLIDFTIRTQTSQPNPPPHSPPIYLFKEGERERGALNTEGGLVSTV